MFKKSVLAVAVMAMTSGVAFAEEAYITQYLDPTTSTAVIEQRFVDGSVNYGAILQEATTGDGVALNAVIFQGLSSDAGAIDPTAPESTVSGTAIDLTVTAYVDGGPSVYEPINAAVANFAYIKQDTTETSQAVIAQLSLDDASVFDSTLTMFQAELALNGIGLTDIGTLSYDGTNNLIDAGVASAIFDNVDDSAGNANNIAAISQGSEALDRNGEVLGGAANTGGVNNLALIIQMGSDNIAQVMQSGDGPQVATVIQADLGNDAFVAQVGDTNTATVLQAAVNGVATVYQTGTGNIASVFQYQSL